VLVNLLLYWIIHLVVLQVVLHQQISNTIDKFPFSADTNASDVGDLTQARAGAAGQQF
jgi:hypothetical protein